MKKVFFFLFLFGIISMSFGQSRIVPGNFSVPKNGERFYLDESDFRNTSRAIGDTQYFWTNFAYTLNELNGSPYQLSGWIMAPDTLLNVRYLDVVGGKYVFVYDNITICAVGSTLDLYSQVLQLPNLYEFTPYTVDSAAITYIYRRYTADDVVDTLIVQLYKPNHLVGGTYTMTGSGDKRAFVVPKYNRSTNMGVMADYTVKIPLTIADTSRTTYFRNKLLQIPSWAMSSGGAFSLTYSFKPGRTYNLGDTIPYAKWDSVQGVSRPINLFRCAVYGDQGKNSLSPETNNGLWITNWCRYTDWNTTVPAFANTFLPGNGWERPLYPIVLFKVKYKETVSVNHLANDVKVMLYPSPVSANQEMKLDMTLDSKKNISIDVYDLLGHKVSSVAKGNYNSGKHSFSISTSNLNAGMYICNVVADGTVKTMKFEVR